MVVPLRSERRPSAISANTPPSPLLSARSSNNTYFAVTTSSSAQRIRDSVPITASAVTLSPDSVAAKIALRNA